MKPLLLSLAIALFHAPLEAAGIALAEQRHGRMPLPEARLFVASAGDGFLAAWSTPRGNAATFVDASGRRVGPAFGLRDGCTNLLALDDGYVLSCFDGPETAVRRLDRAGREIGIVELVSKPDHVAAVSTHGDHVLVARSGQSHVEVAVVDVSGVQIGMSHALPHPGIILDAKPTASGFALLTSESGAPSPLERLYVLTRDGLLVRDAPLPIEQLNTVALGVRGDTVFVVWSTYLHQLRTAIISATGELTVVDHGTIHVDPKQVVSHADGLLVVGRQTPLTPAGGISIVRLRSDGSLANPPALVADGFRVEDAASNGTNLFILASRWVGWHQEAVGLSVPLDAPTQHATPEILSIGPLAQIEATAASIGASQMVVWRETAIDTTFLRMRRLHAGRPDGPVLDVATSLQPLSAPRLVTNGSIALLVWSSADGIVARRIDAAGNFLDFSPLVVRPQADTAVMSRLSVATDGNDFVVAWIESKQLHAVRVTATGHVDPPRLLLDAPPPIPSDGAYLRWDERRGLDIAWTGQQYVIVWTHERRFSVLSAGGIEFRELRMISVDSAITTAMSGEIPIIRGAAEPRVAHGDGVLAVFGDRPFTGIQDVVLVDSSTGRLLARHEIRGGAYPREFTADRMIAWDGDDFVFTWRNVSETYLGRLPPGGRPRISRLGNVPAESPLIVLRDEQIEVLVSERRFTESPSAMLVLYDEAHFTPLVSRGRAVGR